MKEKSTLAGLAKKSQNSSSSGAKSFAQSPKSQEQPLKPLTVRVTLDRHTKLKQAAAERHISMGDLVSELIDSL